MRTPSATNRAIGHVTSLISASATHRSPGANLLPPVRTLAKDAGVSLVTMVKAIKTLRTQGLIDVVQGKRMRPAEKNRGAVPAEEGAGEPQSSGKLWQMIKTRIARDIHTGSYDEAAAFPSVKEMAGMYGVNYRTIKKALAALARQDMIVPLGRRFRIPRPVRTRAGGKILVFIHDPSETLSLSFIDPSLLRHIETQARRLGLSVTFIRFYTSGDTVTYINHESGASWSPRLTPDAIGCLWIVFYTQEILIDCCEKLLSLDRPVAVMDLTGELLYPAFFFNHPSVRFFSDHDVAQPTRIVGNYLLKLGHRHVASITVWSDQPWAIGRLEGLQQAYAAAGFSDGVRSFATAISWPSWNLDSAAGGYIGTRRAITSVARIGLDLAQGDHRRAANHARRTLGSAIDQSFFLLKLANELDLLCERALKDERITAWVFGSDVEALAGLDFLKRRNIPVPGRISVVGFINSLDALKAGLTSFYHDFEAHVPGILSYLAWPNRFTKLHKNKVTIFEGIISERRTTAPPSKA